MKYAVISDIHGNLPALELALGDAEQMGAQAFLFAGDYCISAPWAAGVVQRMQAAPNALAVCGNEERYLHLPDGEDGQFTVSRWTGRSLQPEQIAWLDSLPEQLAWECEGVALHMAHDSQVFIGDAETGEFRTELLPLRYPAGIPHEALLQDVRGTLAGSAAFRKRLEQLPKGVYIFGHTHSQWHAFFDDHLFLNPGSCGMPLDCGDFGAAYALLTVEGGRCSVEERRVPYDVEALIARVRQTDQYRAARVWSELIFCEWRSCRERVMYFLRHAQRYAQQIGDSRRPFMPDTWEAAYEDWLQNGDKP